MDVLTALEKIAAVRPRVLVTGDFCHDVWHAGMRRPNPEHPVGPERGWPVVRVERSWQTAGMAGAVAAMARALGAAVDLYCPPQTTKKHRLLAPPELGAAEAVVCRWDEDAEPPSPCRAGSLGRFVASELPAFQAVLIADYGKGCCCPDFLGPVLASARVAGLPVLVDPAMSDCRAPDCWVRYRGATLVKCNAAEWEAVGDRGRSRAVLAEFPAIVVTDGPRGLRLWDRGAETWFHLRSPWPVDRPLDVCGAGDQTLAVLGVCLAAGVDWLSACDLANVAAGLKVQRRGAVPVFPHEIREEVARARCA